MFGPRRLSLASLLLFAALATAGQAQAQHHGGRSSPATAPPMSNGFGPASQSYAGAAPQSAVEAPVAVSSGLGAIQFSSVNYGVPAPQALTRQLHYDDERVRSAALSALGVPTQYLQHGHIPYAHSVALAFAELGANEEVDALLTVELDEHIVTAVLVPADGNWRRIATLTFATAFSDTSTTPDRWLRLARSLVQHERYRAVFRASTGSLRGGSLAENEAHLRVLNGRAVITISFESTLRQCATDPAADAGSPARISGCAITQRWLQPNPIDPWRRFEMVSATGVLTRAEANSPLMLNPAFQLAHLRTFSCQPFTFADASGHFEPVGPTAACHTR